MPRKGVLATAVSMLVGFNLLLATPYVAAQDEPKPPAKTPPAPPGGSGRRPTPAEVAKEDLAKVQGTWEHEVRDPQGKRLGRIVKHIQSTKEMIVHERADGQVTHAHRADFEVGRFGPVEVFRWFKGEAIEGRQKGQKGAQGAYVYRVDDKTFTAAMSFLVGQENQPATLRVYTKVKAAEAPAAE